MLAPANYSSSMTTIPSVEGKTEADTAVSLHRFSYRQEFLAHSSTGSATERDGWVAPPPTLDTRYISFLGRRSEPSTIVVHIPAFRTAGRETLAIQTGQLARATATHVGH